MKNKIIILFLIFLPFQEIVTQTRIVNLISIDGAINPASSDFIQSSIRKAEKSNAECLIIELNTPGGLLKSTRVIVSSFLQSNIPIVVYVAPQGSQAASAGVFVTMAAHIAVMSPGTNIGAAHPVSLEGQQDSIMMEKATNDAVAFIKTISEKRKRNVQWAEDAVRKSLSITEKEALEKNVIDFLANNRNDLLSKLNGREVETEKGITKLNTEKAKLEIIEMSFSQKLLNILSDPNFAYILFILGFYGLLFELYSPGAIFPGVLGVICLILAFYSLHTLPVNYAGIALIVFAIVLFLLEIKIVSHGLLTIGGVISLFLGSIMLIQPESTLEFAKISWEVIISVVVFSVLFFLFAIGLGIRAQRLKPTTGSEGIIGETGIAFSDLKPEGKIFVHGEIWNAESIEGEILKDTKIIVESMRDLTLLVKKLN
ncbi:MAG: nodulation protein NfeD [Ignavibacterium sp.]